MEIKQTPGYLCPSQLVLAAGANVILSKTVTVCIVLFRNRTVSLFLQFSGTSQPTHFISRQLTCLLGAYHLTVLSQEKRTRRDLFYIHWSYPQLTLSQQLFPNFVLAKIPRKDSRWILHIIIYFFWREEGIIRRPESQQTGTIRLRCMAKNPSHHCGLAATHVGKAPGTNKAPDARRFGFATWSA